jgi:uroporphyrinogen decarboxylase
VSVKEGAVQREVEVAKRLVERYHGKVPVIATVFTPVTYAQELYNGFQNPWPFGDLIRYYGDDLEAGLDVITDVTRNIIEEFVKVSVDGIFYSSHFMNDKVFTPELYERFGKPYDLQAFEPALGKTWFNMMHIHGDTNLFFDIAKDYPFEAFNWEDTITNVSLAQAHEMLPDKVLVAGVDRNTDFREENRDVLLKNMIKRVKAAQSQVPIGKLVVAGGCAQGTDIPDYRFDTLKEAMEIVYGEKQW